MQIFRYTAYTLEACMSYLPGERYPKFLNPVDQSQFEQIFCAIAEAGKA